VAVIFPRWTNLLPLAVAAGAPFLLGAAVGGVWYYFSPKYTDVGYTPQQPVPYSHALHVGALGMDCRYCHDTVERAAYAALPATQTCMNCHVTVLPESPKLALIRESAKTGAAVPWVNVHRIPDYAFFDHSVHVAAGVGCATCHGRVDQMEVVGQVQPLSMRWCLDCHRDPLPNLRPRELVTNMAWDASAAAYDPKADPARPRLPSPPVHCSGCHR
jgi:hypothetical protein